MILVFVVYALFASVFTALKWTLAFASPLFLVGSRMLLAGLCMIGYIAWKDRSRLKLSSTDWISVIFLALINIYLTNAFEILGMAWGLTSFKSCFLYSLSPFLSALFSYWLLRETLSWKKWVGLIIGIAAFWPMLIKQDVSELPSSQLWLFSWAELAGLGAVIASVLGWILLKKLVQTTSPIIANGYSMIIGGSLALIHSALQEPWTPLPVSDYSSWIAGSCFLIIVSNMICYNLYGFLLQRFSPTFMAFAGLSTPIFASLFGWIFLHESVTIWLFVSLSFVLIGLGVLYCEETHSS